MRINIGIDVGNYDTKTQHTTIPSSYRQYTARNLMSEEYICYKGLYYTPTKERNNQQLDKTENNYCLIVSLFAIAKEILYTITHATPGLPEEEIQAHIDEYTELGLGIGLPAGYYSSLANDTVDFYLKNWEKGVTFEYNQYHFHLALVKCCAFPQDFTAVAWNENIDTVKRFNDYYIIGIGGGTADVIPVSDGKPSVEKCETIPRGSTVMYAEIIKTIQHETGRTMDYSAIENVLRERPNIIDDARKKRVFEIAQEFVNKLVDEFVHLGLLLSDYPCVFIGGGALMMRKYLEANPLFAKTEFVKDVNANAKYYAVFTE